MKLIKAIFRLFGQLVQAATNLAEETEAWTMEFVAESKMVRLDMAEERKVQLAEIELETKAKLQKLKKLENAKPA